MSGPGPMDDYSPPLRPSTSGDGGGDGGPPQDDCAFTEITVLSSPNQAVIQTLGVGSVLAVVHETQPASRVVAMSNLDIAGSITSAKVMKMIECMNRGYNYAATIREIAGGRVTVEVHPA